MGGPKRDGKRFTTAPAPRVQIERVRGCPSGGRAHRERAEAVDDLAKRLQNREAIEVGIGRAVRRAMAVGVTQRELAEVLGVTQATVSRRYSPASSVTVGNKSAVDNGNDR